MQESKTSLSIFFLVKCDLRTKHLKFTSWFIKKVTRIEAFDFFLILIMRFRGDFSVIFKKKGEG
jgi:hypothetical protein